MPEAPDTTASRALVFAPLGRDAVVAGSLLRAADIGFTICPHLAALQAWLGESTTFAVVTEEDLGSADLRSIAAWVDRQPTWSDLPFVILTRRGGNLESNPGAARLSEILGNVTFLERPFHPTTFISVARTALKGRLKQYDARARIEELDEGEKRLRTALLAGRLGSWELDLSSQTLRSSDTCQALFGHAGNEPFCYSDMIAAVHPEDQAAMRATIETGVDYAIEHRTIWPDGGVHWAEIHARLVRDRGGSRLVGVSSDITEWKRNEKSLRYLNGKLEERVAERTAELKAAHAQVVAEAAQRQHAEEKLRQAQKMEVIGQITGGVAHDFNNLLTAVLGNLELLRKHIPDDSRAARLIDGATQGAQRGAALTQRLLAFARRQDLRIEPTDLLDLVDGMTELLRRSVGSSIELRLDIPGMLPAVLVDANQLELALLNLAVNARDAMPGGGVLSIKADHLEAADHGELRPGPYIRLIVSDTGQGMDAETLKRAPEPFFSTKEFGKGTGLGLSMVHGLALQLNGALRMSSELGRGTTAELWLPATFMEAEAAGPTPDAARAAAAASNVTILVVDDDALIAMSTVEMLEDLGHAVIEANSGKHALEILREEQTVDLLITDYSMPNMTGAQLAKAARELRPELPILLATGYAELPRDSDIDLPRLGKPYQQDQLAREIEKVLRFRAA
jgi:PAS domain S-box-containing protein